LPRSLSSFASSSQAQQFIAELLRARSFTSASSQAQTQVGELLQLSGEPSIYIAYVPAYVQLVSVNGISNSVVVPPEPDAAIVPPIDYEITV
jgi:hypothetical protein